jgi:Fe-S cluster assembly protein SufD
MPNTLERLSLKEKLLADFTIRKSALLLENPVLKGFREKAVEAFALQGFPGKKHEEYRYLQVEKVLTAELNNSLTPENPVLSADADIFNHPLLVQDAYKVVLMNGFFSTEFSHLSGLPEGVLIRSLANAIRDNDVHALSNLGTMSKSDSDPFLALNSALFTDGLFCYIPPHVHLDKPIQILQLVTGTDALLIQPRILFIADASSKVHVVQTFLSLHSNISSCSNTVTEVLAEKHAHVEWITLQAENQTAGHFNSTEAHVKQHGNFKTVTITLGAGLVRNNLNIVLDAPECEAHLYGYYHPLKGQTFDNHTLVDHRFPRCESNELYKGVIGDFGTAVFNGKVYVRKDAQKTNAYQSNKNILLSDTSTVNTKPQLEIYADDVKCSHGSSTGVLDPEQVFYLRSRGISLEKARALLLTAYAGEILEHIPHLSVREAVGKLISERI